MNTEALNSFSLNGLGPFSVVPNNLSGIGISANVSNYKWMTGSLLSAQQSSSVQPYVNCQIVTDSFTVTDEVVTTTNPLTLGASTNAPDGALLVIGFDATGHLRFGKITDASQASQWSNIQQAITGIEIDGSYPCTFFVNQGGVDIPINPNIAVSNWINGTYVIDIYYWTSTGGKYQIVQSRSYDGGNTFTAQQIIQDTGILTSQNFITQPIWLAAGQPHYNSVTGLTSASVYYISYFGSSGGHIQYALNPNEATLWSGCFFCQWPLNLDPYDWQLHSFDVITVPQVGATFTEGSLILGGLATYIVWSGYHTSLGNSTSYGLYWSRIYNLSGNDALAYAEDVWGEAKPILTISSGTNQNVTNFYYPSCSWDGTSINMVARGDVVTDINDNGIPDISTGYFLWSSSDFKNFTYPLQLIDTQGNVFNTPLSVMQSAYRIVPQFIRTTNGGNFYYASGSGSVWQYEKGGVIADISNYIISYNITEQAGSTSSIQITISNSANKWYGTNPTQLGASAIVTGSRIYLKQGYFNADGVPESIPRNVYYITDIKQNVSTSDNDLIITGIDYNTLLQNQTTKYTYNFTGPDFYYDIFNGSSVAQWNLSQGQWTQVANPGTNLLGSFLPLTGGTPTDSPSLSGQTLAALSGFTIDKQISAMSVMAYIPENGEVDIYPFYIDGNNYMMVSIVGSGVNTVTVSASGMCQGNAVSYSLSEFGSPGIIHTSEWCNIYITKKFFQQQMQYMITLGNQNGSPNVMTNFMNAYSRWIASPTATNVFPQNSVATIALGTNGTWATPVVGSYGFASLKFMQYDYSQDIEELTKSIGTLANITSYKSEHDFDIDTYILTNWSTLGTVSTENNSLVLGANSTAWYTGADLSDQTIEFDAKATPQTVTLDYGFELLFRSPIASLDNALAVRFGSHFNSSSGTPPNAATSVAYLIAHDASFEDSGYGGYQLYNTVGNGILGVGVNDDNNAFFDLHIDWTQWHHYKITFSAGWVYAYVDDRLVIAYYLDYADMPMFDSGFIGFNTKYTSFSSNTNTCSIEVKNIVCPTFWGQINSFSINTGDDFQNAVTQNLATVYGFNFSDIAGRFKMIKTYATDPPTYYYGAGASNYQLISQSVAASNNEYINEIVVIGDGVQATAQDAASIGSNAKTRTLVITDLKIQTLADAQAAATQALVSADKYGVQPSPMQMINVGSEIFDVVNVEDTSTVNSTGLDGNYRIYVQSFNMGGTQYDYTMTFSTGNVATQQ